MIMKLLKQKQINFDESLPLNEVTNGKNKVNKSFQTIDHSAQFRQDTVNLRENARQHKSWQKRLARMIINFPLQTAPVQENWHLFNMSVRGQNW